MNKKITAASAIALFAAQAFAPAAFAQRHLNVAEKHPTVTGVAAGAATHHALKVSARHKKAQGRKLNFAERHPTLSAIGAAATTHHVLKTTARHKGH